MALQHQTALAQFNCQQCHGALDGMVTASENRGHFAIRHGTVKRETHGLDELRQIIGFRAMHPIRNRGATERIQLQAYLIVVIGIRNQIDLRHSTSP